MPSGKMWYRRPSKPSRPPLPRSDYPESCLISLHSRQGLNSTGLNTFWWSHPSSPSLAPLHIKANQTSQRLTLFSSVHMGTSAQTQPTLACITLRRIKHLIYTAKKKKKTKMSGFPGGSVSKESTCNVGDLGSIPGLGRSPREGNSYLLQYSCLENPYGQRSLVGYSPWDGKEWDMTEYSTA